MNKFILEHRIKQRDYGNWKKKYWKANRWTNDLSFRIVWPLELLNLRLFEIGSTLFVDLERHKDEKRHWDHLTRDSDKTVIPTIYWRHFFKQGFKMGRFQDVWLIRYESKGITFPFKVRSKNWQFSNPGVTESFKNMVSFLSLWRTMQSCLMAPKVFGMDLFKIWVIMIVSKLNWGKKTVLSMSAYLCFKYHTRHLIRKRLRMLVYTKL